MIRQTENPEEIGLSGEAIQTACGILEEAVVRGELMGAALQVSRGGVALPPACFGRRKLDPDGPPVEPDTVFLIASITKPIVAAAVMLLVERGEVCLDDLVAELVPEFGRAGKEGVQVRHLLTHTSGLPDMLPENLALRAEHAPLDVFVQQICKVKLLFEPGTRISYQSCGIAMLGEIVQRVEATPVRMFLRREFFEPMGLVDTSLGLRKRNARESDVKIHSGEYGEADAVSWNWNSDYWRGFGAPWGGLLTTTAELTALCQAFLYDGALNGNRILNPATVAAMTMDQTSTMPDLTHADRTKTALGVGMAPARPGEFNLRRSDFGRHLRTRGGNGHGGMGGSRNGNDVRAVYERPARRCDCTSAGVQYGCSCRYLGRATLPHLECIASDISFRFQECSRQRHPIVTWCFNPQPERSRTGC